LFFVVVVLSFLCLGGGEGMCVCIYVCVCVCICMYVCVCVYAEVSLEATREAESALYEQKQRTVRLVQNSKYRHLNTKMY